MRLDPKTPLLVQDRVARSAGVVRIRAIYTPITSTSSFTAPTDF